MSAGAWPGAGTEASHHAAMMGAMMSNPQLMQQMAALMQNNPALLETMMQSHPLLQNLPPEQRAATMQMVLQMMQNGSVPGGFGYQGAPNQTAQSSSANAQQTYASQLETLRGMGFPNESANLSALQMSGGNVEMAISRLLGE